MCLSLVNLNQVKTMTKCFLFALFILSLTELSCKKTVRQSPTDLTSGVPTDANIMNGYTTSISVAPGDSISVCINAGKAGLTLVGLYDINQELIDQISCSIAPQQMQTSSPSENGFGYGISFTYKVPANTKSGVYLWANKIPFIVRSSNPNDDIAVIYPSNTAMAYNTEGGADFYSTPRVNSVSILRPTFVQKESLYFLKWAPTINKNIAYLCDADLEDAGSIFGKKVLIIIGHSEYWTRNARLNFDNYIKAGGNAIFLSGNNMWWQCRLSPNKKSIICYKDQSADTVSNPLLTTCYWHYPVCNYSTINSIGSDSQKGGYGIKQPANGWDGYKIVCANSPILEGTTLAVTGKVLSCPTQEFDCAPINWVLPDSIPVYDNSSTQFYKAEIIGYDKCMDFVTNTYQTFGTWIVIKPSINSGTIINVGSTDWCGFRGMGSSRDKVLMREITLKMINLLQSNQNAFSY